MTRALPATTDDSDDRARPAVRRKAGGRRAEGGVRSLKAERSRRRILNHALKDFAEHGFAGARVDRIARRARVDKNLIYHYFKSKENLFIEVMERAYAIIVEYHRERLMDVDDPVAAIENFVCSTFEIFLENPQLVNLLNTENLHRARHIRKSPVIGTAYRPLLDRLASVLEEGARRGLLRPGIDPSDLFISITGIAYFYVSNRHTIGVILNQNLDDAARIAQRRRHIVDLVRHALLAGREQADGTERRASKGAT